MGAGREVPVQLDGFERRLMGDEAGFSWCSSSGDRRRFGALVITLEMFSYTYLIASFGNIFIY